MPLLLMVLCTPCLLAGGAVAPQGTGLLGRCNGAAGDRSTISAVSSTARSSTSAPAVAHSLEMFSASLWLRPPTHGHMIIVEGATLFIQQASWPAPEMIFIWLSTRYSDHLRTSATSMGTHATGSKWH